MSESVLRPIILRNKKQWNQRNEATTNYERSVVLHPMGAYPEGAVLCTKSECRNGFLTRNEFTSIPFCKKFLYCIGTTGIMAETV